MSSQGRVVRRHLNLNLNQRSNFMKMRPFLSGAILGLLLTAAMPLTTLAVEGQDFDLKTTRNLYDLCSVKSDDPNFLHAYGACKGFIQGTVQYHDGISDKKNLKRLICYSETTTIADGITAFVAWGAANLNNTKEMNGTPVIGLVHALAAKYPCAK